VAGLVGVGIIALVARLNIYRRPAASADIRTEEQNRFSLSGRPAIGFLAAFSPYLILSIIVIIAQLVAPVSRLLSWKKIVLQFPELTTRFGYQTPAGPSKAINLFGHAGALLFYAAIISFFLYRATGHLKAGSFKRIIAATLQSAVPATVGIISMVGFATIMSHCGMTHLLALGISRFMGRFFPIFSASLGALGAFMTGSNTNSNFLFGPLQMETAQLLGISVVIILAAQTTGGSLGSMLAPAKIIVGCSTAGLAGREGLVLRKTIIYGSIITGIIGVLAWTAVYMLQLH
jgi:lactate permease